jgi:hypothetical protein
MDKPHVKGVADNVVKNVEGNVITPQRMRAERKLDDVKRATDTAREFIGGGRIPARSAMNESLPRE